VSILKRKRILSILLCLTLLLGTVPLAAAENAPAALPDGYEQLYYNGQTVVSISLNGGVLLEGSLFTDSAGTLGLNMRAYALRLSATDGSLGALNYPPPGCVLDAGSSAVSGATGWLYAEPTDGQSAKYALQVQITEAAGGNPGGPPSGMFPGSDGPEPPSRFIVRPAGDLTDEDMILESNLMAGPIAFTIEAGGEVLEYYMGITMWTTAEVSDAAGDFFVLETEESAGSGISFRYRSIGFWKMDHNENVTHVKGEELQTILEAFEDENGNSTLSLDLKARTNVGQAYPTVWDCSAMASADWPCAKVYGFPVGEGGRWIYTASGTLKDGTVVVARSGFYRSYMTLQTFDATGLAADEVVEAVNEWFAAVAHQDNMGFDPEATYQAILPAVSLSGEIYIPEGINASVTCDGIAQLTGGIRADGFCTAVNIAFVGAGKDRATWPDGTPNFGIYGAGGGEVQYCSFTGFACAVQSTDKGHLAIYNSSFRDNNVAVFAGRGITDIHNGTIRGCLFDENNIAFVLESALAIDRCSISETVFTDNRCDIANTSGRKFFITGNYFVHGDSATEIVDTGKWTKGPVFVGPVYTFCEDGVFAELYWGKNVTMHNKDTGKHPIPKSKLNGTFTVIDQPDTDKEISVSFHFDELETSAVSMFRLRRSAEETFDATVGIEKTDELICLTINTLPSEKTPIVTVPCADWYGAAVFFDGAAVESAFADGCVSFVAEQGGTYSIERIKPEPEPEITPPVIPMSPVNVAAGGDGSVSLSTMYAMPGDTVTFTVTPKSGYAVSSICVTDIFGNVLFLTDRADGSYAFQMPYYGVSISVSYAVNLPYEDISPDDEHFDAIAFMYEKDLMFGTGDGSTFAPEKSLTRAMAAAILYRIAGEPETAYSGTFHDVADEKWYTSAIEWAVANGIVFGVSADRFSPHAELTGEQILAMLYRFAGSPGILCSQYEHVLSEAKVSTWAYPAVCWALEEGLLSAEASLDQTNSILRGEIAELLMQYLTH